MPDAPDTKVYRPAPRASAHPRLRVEAGPRGLVGREYPLSKPVVTVGRRADQDIVLPDPTVSRTHLWLVRTEGGVAVRDLGSTNGTRVNGRPLGPGAVVLRPGDRVHVGTVVLEYLGEA